MQLLDGIKEYERHEGFFSGIQPLEKEAEIICELIAYHKNNPPPGALKKAKNFIISVEAWKANCDSKRMGHAVLNNEDEVWGALMDSLNASEDVEALLAIMNLRGFGRSIDQETGTRRSKVASAVLRFLQPCKWGVVDWRNAAIAGLYKKHNGNIAHLLDDAKTLKTEELRDLYDRMDEKVALDLNKQYRAIRCDELPRAADVDMAMFGLSLIAWKMK